MTLIGGLLLALAVSLLAGLLYWLLVSTEGVFLGRRLVVWLYDITAHKYDAIKQYNREDEHFAVARPLLEGLASPGAPRILDVAAGSGRLAASLLDGYAVAHSNPRGQNYSAQIAAVDASLPMLRLADDKPLLARAQRRGQLALIQALAGALPFADHSFDAVTCLEALEFFPSDVTALAEMVRVLRPGGLLMTSRRRGWEGRLFLHRYRSDADLEALLVDLGLRSVQTELWQINYDRVIARKPDQ
ncbi:MAG: class I SAM-dependent methyltransferase [Candidatus Promineifilaceae bacterium]|nr:class I SAM-dependent methyltransferase [Candidatus Promineifilaceae bacterium]